LWVPPALHDGDANNDANNHDNDEFLDLEFQHYDNVHNDNDNDNNNNQECSIPNNEYKQLSTSARQAKVMSFLGIQRVKPVSASSAASPLVISSSSFALQATKYEGKEEEDDDNDNNNCYSYN
jgi:hypothetical protein